MQNHYPGVHISFSVRLASSANMFSEHTISCSLNGFSRVVVPARTVPAGTRSNRVLGTNRPLSHASETKSEQCETENMFLNWAGLSTQTAISTESAR